MKNKKQYKYICTVCLHQTSSPDILRKCPKCGGLLTQNISRKNNKKV